MSLITVIGVSASILCSICSVPQLIKIIKEKNAKSISLVMLGFLIAGLLLWTYYGILVKDYIIIVSNAFTVIINVLVLSFAGFYKYKS